MSPRLPRASRSCRSTAASKARAEELVHSSGLDWAIVRPPAVYGPGDKETLELFRMAKLGLMLMPPKGRVSVIHAEDLARLLLALAGPGGAVEYPDRGRRRQARRLDSPRVRRARLPRPSAPRPAIISSPGFLLRLAARADHLLRGEKAKLTADRAAYFSHRNWVIEPKRACPPQLWQPQIDTAQGLKATADWYREKGWL